MSTFPDIPGYRIQAELGRGGMAVVYSAIETNLGRNVAIKVVGAAPGVDRDGHIERLENEARGLAALHHPHIVDLYMFGRTADGSLFYVMPLLPGGSLEDWPRPVPEERVVALLDNLLDALGHAHASDIIHRDIKPANILFDQHGRPLLADFGAALMRRRDSRLTTHGGAIGSSGYMSPEQARGLGVDARSDLYSTAVLAFELLTGRRPFEGADDLAIAIAQTEQPVPTLPDALRHWQPFFARALAVRPEQRFADSAVMRAAIRDLRPASARPARKRNNTMAMTLVAAAILLGALVFAFWPRKPAEPVHAAAVEALWNAGHLTPPDSPNVRDELERAQAQDVDRAQLDALQVRLFDRLAADVDAALAAADAAAAATAWLRWRETLTALDSLHADAVVAREASIAATLRTQLAAALAAYDRRAADPALAVLEHWDAAAPALRELADDARAIAIVGAPIEAADGPELVLATAADGEHPALAIMTAPVDAALYGRFLAARGREADTCTDVAAPARGCIDLETARSLSNWLGETSGGRYRVPERDELAPLLAHVQTMPAYALTGTCNEVRVAGRRNVASRIRSGVREIFGRGATAAPSVVRCSGQFALKLDGGPGEARVQDGTTPDTVIVLVREMSGSTGE